MILSFIKKTESLSVSQLRWAIVVLGMLIAAQIQYIQHGWINPDSILYFEGARLFALGEWKQAADIFPWPLYALSIAIVSKITSLDVHLSAQILNVVYFGVATYSFLKIIELAGGKSHAMLAGALILFSSQYIVGDVLEMLLRDEGFWAFFLASLVFFIRFYKTNLTHYAVLWQICAITATLFRLEGITYLIGLPILLLFAQHQILLYRVRQYLTANALSIMIFGCILAVITLSSNLTMSHFGRLNEVFSLNLYNEFTKNLFEKSDIMSQQVLGKYLDEFAVQGLLLTFIYVMLSKAVSTTGIINVGLAFFALKFKDNVIDRDVFQILKVTAIIALINMALIITKVFVLSSRYVVPLAFVLMILASLYLASAAKFLYPEHSKNKKWKWLVIGLIVLMLLGIFKNILPKQHGHNYMQEAVSWVKTHNSNNSSVYYNDSRVKYYAGEAFTGMISDSWLTLQEDINNQSINRYTYLLVSLDSGHLDDEKMLGEKLPNYKLIKTFNSKKNKKKMLVFIKNK